MDKRVYRVRRRPVRGSRVASCAEVACDGHVNGWRTVLDPADTARLNYVRHDSRRHFREALVGGLVEFTFPPGQQCFVTHRVDAELLHIVRDHDRVGVLTAQFRHTRPELWAEDFAENQQALADRQARG